jgi:hypothetical protein
MSFALHVFQMSFALHVFQVPLPGHILWLKILMIFCDLLVFQCLAFNPLTKIFTIMKYAVAIAISSPNVS